MRNIKNLLKPLFLLIVVAATGAALYTAHKSKQVCVEGHLFEEAPMFSKRSQQWEWMRHRDPRTGDIPKGIFRASIQFAKTLPGALGMPKNNRDRLLAQQWKQRGPANIGGRTRALAYDVRNENNILAGGVSGGMWKSIDGGNTWSKKISLMQLQSVSCITQDKRPGKENIWYYGTGEYFNIYGGLAGDGVYKSTNNGETWESLASTISNTPNLWNSPFDYNWNIITNHKNLEQDEVLVATAAGGIFRSVDGGKSFEPVLGGGFGRSYPWFTDIAISPSGVMYATLSQRTFDAGAKASGCGLYRSTNGKNWTNITPANWPRQYWRVVIGISPSDENKVYFFGQTPESGILTFNSQGDSLWHSFWKYTYISGDGSGNGGKWEDRSLNLPSEGKTRLQMNTQGSYDMVIAVKPDDPETVIIGGTNLYRSTDGFKSKENTTIIGGYCPEGREKECLYDFEYPNHHADQHAIVFSYINPNILFTGSDGGVHKTLDVRDEKVEWISLNNSYITTQFYTCAIDKATPGSQEIIGGLQDNGTLFTRWADNKKGWTNPNYSDGFYCNIEDGGRFYYVAQNASKQPMHQIFRVTLDEDGQRLIKTRIDPIGGLDFMWVNPYKLDPNNQKRMYLAGGQIVWRNNNLDAIPVVETTDSISTEWDSIPQSRIQFGRISALSVSKTPQNIVYYGTNYGEVYKIENANSKEPKVTNITSNSFPRSGFVGCVSVDPKDGNKVFAVFHNFNVKSVFYSTDAGKNWRHVTGNLEEEPGGLGAGPACYWIEVLPIGDKYLYLMGTSTGLYSTSFIEGEDVVWRQEAADVIGNAMVYMLASRESDGYVVAATHGVGMFSANIQELHQPLAKAPQLILPVDGKSGILQEVTLEWQTLEGAGNYKVEISDSPNFTKIIKTIEGVKGTNIKINDLEQGYKTYYWRVTARNEGGFSPYSQVWSFRTAIAPPLLVLPEDGATSVETSTNLKWLPADGAVSYHLMLSTLPNFGSLIVDTIVQGSTDLFVEGLLGNRRHYWQISSIDADGEGVFSNRRSFTTKKVTSVEDKHQFYVEQIEKLSPNPTSNSISVSFMIKKPDKGEIIIVDMEGNTYSKLSKQFKAGNNKETINLYGVPSGRYFCLIKINGKLLSKPFTVLK